MAKFRLKALAPTEHQTQAAILRYLAISPRVAWARRMNTGAIKIPAANGRDRFVRFGFPGCSDILGQLTDGRLLAIEVKSPSGRASENQGAFLALVANATCRLWTERDAPGFAIRAMTWRRHYECHSLPCDFWEHT